MSHYLGPALQITPEELGKYDSTDWVAEEKRDGAWCEVHTNASGTITTILGRTGKQFSGSNVVGLVGLQTPWYDSVFAGELEAATESATKIYKTVGFRRIHMFDLVRLLGEPISLLAYEDRGRLLGSAITHKAVADNVRQRILRTTLVESGFETFYQNIVSNGGEGIVLKRRTSLYKGYSGRTEHWIRCKPLRFVDYFCVGLGKASGGTTVLRLALFRNGEFQEIGRITAPVAVRDSTTLVGQVIECKGAEIHSNGMLRHARFHRVRNDKNPEMCVD